MYAFYFFEFPITIYTNKWHETILNYTKFMGVEERKKAQYGRLIEITIFLYCRHLEKINEEKIYL